MRDHEAISPKRLKAATTATVQQPGFEARMSWWLQGAHAAERWLQFEWAFHLQSVLRADRADFAVLCERKYVDVVCVRLPTSGRNVWESEIAAGVEIKWFGNWWVNDESLLEAGADVGKISTYPFPAAAAVFFLAVEPSDSAPLLTWVRDYAKRSGVPSHDVFLERLAERVGEPQASVHEVIAPSDNLSALSLHAFFYYNSTAQNLSV